MKWSTRAFIGVGLAATLNTSAMAGDLPPLPANQPVIGVDGTLPIISSDGHQRIAIEVLDPKLSSFRISYNLMANQGLDEATLRTIPSFAIYDPNWKMPSSMPEWAKPHAGKACGAFLNVAFDYRKTGKNEVTIDLTNWRELRQALNRYGCVVISNQEKFRAGSPSKLAR